MDQCLVGQKVDKRAAVAGHLCSVSRSDCGPDTGGSKHGATRGGALAERGRSGFSSCGAARRVR